QQVERRVAEDDEQAEEDRVRDDDAVERLEAGVEVAPHAAARLTQIPAQRRAKSLPPRLTREIAPDLPAQAGPRDGEGIGEPEIGIFRRPGLGMVLEMVGAVRP